MEGRKREDIKYIANYIIKESLGNLIQRDKEILVLEYGKTRDALTLTFEKDVLDDLYATAQSFNLKIGEMIEVCIYVYFNKNFSEDEYAINRMNEWKISFGS